MKSALPVAAMLVAVGFAGCAKDPRSPGTGNPVAASTPGEPAVAASAASADQPPTASATPSPADLEAALKNFHPLDPQVFSHPLATLDGTPTTLGALRGRALLVVNVASKCGLTPQYAELEALQKEYAEHGFAVVGFPCNQFGGQEPGTAAEIKEFCSLTYGVTFPMMEKIEVNGDGRHPIYQTLTRIPDAEGRAGDIEWNFEKFVITADGTKVARFRPGTAPKSPEVLAALHAALAAK